MSRKRALLIVPPAHATVYQGTKLSPIAYHYPSLPLGSIAAGAGGDWEISILDLNLLGEWETELARRLLEFKPELAGVTALTPLFPLAIKILELVKRVSPHTLTIVGGPHASALPEEVIALPAVDLVCLQEGDFILREMSSHWGRWHDIPNLLGKEVMRREDRTIPPLDPDSLPFPAWDKFDLKRYHLAHLTSRTGPVGILETSRGCGASCIYCNKSVFGYRFRAKSPLRVLEDMERYQAAGFKEFHISDDCFTADLDRAKTICNMIISRGYQFSWNLTNGIRVDQVDREFFRLARRAGLWQVAFGVESGDESLLAQMNKGINLAQIHQAVAWAKAEGLSTFGFFILGLPGETEKSLKKTGALALKLDFDLAKFNLAVPLPGTLFFKEMERQGRIISRDWTRYSFHHCLNEPVFEHPQLSRRTIIKYYHRAFRRFYFRPRFLSRRLAWGIKNQDLAADLRLASQIKWF